MIFHHHTKKFTQLYKQLMNEKKFCSNELEPMVKIFNGKLKNI